MNIKALKDLPAQIVRIKWCAESSQPYVKRHLTDIAQTLQSMTFTEHDTARLMLFHEKLAQVLGIVNRVNKANRGRPPAVWIEEAEKECRDDLELLAFCKLVFLHQVALLYEKIWEWTDGQEADASVFYSHAIARPTSIMCGTEVTQ